MSLPSGGTKQHSSGLRLNSEEDKSAAQEDVYLSPAALMLLGAWRSKNGVSGRAS